MNIRSTLFALLSSLPLAATVFAQSADPTVAAATHVPPTIAVGQISQLRTDFANAGFDPIPANSIRLSICGAHTYYRSNGVTPPGGYGTNFTWTHATSDCWEGINKAVIAAGAGGMITLDYIGQLATTAPQTTSVDMEVIANPASFTNENRVNNDAIATLAVAGQLPAKHPRNERAPRKGDQWR
ncbi:MAG: hypothetical protein H7203_04890 [Rhizobacter sp.]|nr:hypothetical protein [Burkholderiales bacterium]